MTPPPSTHHESEPSVQQRLQEWQAAGLITIEEQATISAYEDKKRATHIGHQRISLLEVGIYAAVAIGIFGVEFIVNGAIGTFTAVNLPAPTIQGTNALTFFVFAAAAAVAAFMLNRFPDAAAHRGVAASLAASYMFAAISIFLYLLWSGLGGDTLTRAIVAYSISLVLAGASIRWFANGWMASVFVGSAVVVTSTLIAKADWGANSWGFGVLWILYAALLLAVAEFAI